MNSLIQSRKLEVKKSNIHGYGVFANENINKGEVLEECHFMSIPYTTVFDKKYNQILDYGFKYPIEDPSELAWPLGNGCIYNSSKNNNADWNLDLERRLFIFRAIKDIKKGEEICTYYEDNVEWFTKNN